MRSELDDQLSGRVAVTSRQPFSDILTITKSETGLI